MVNLLNRYDRPFKVVRAALEDAASVAGLLITTEAVVADKPNLGVMMQSAVPQELRIGSPMGGPFFVETKTCLAAASELYYA